MGIWMEAGGMRGDPREDSAFILGLLRGKRSEVREFTSPTLLLLLPSSQSVM